MYNIDDDLKDFIESGVAVIVGTGTADCRPHLAYGWSPRVVDSSIVQVFLDAERATPTLEDLSANGQIAVTMAHPVTYRSVQIKGMFRDSFAPTDEDKAWVAAQREAFLISTSIIGDPPAVIRNSWLEEVVGVTFAVDHAFDQTPGPNAGQPL